MRVLILLWSILGLLSSEAGCVHEKPPDACGPAVEAFTGGRQSVPGDEAQLGASTRNSGPVRSDWRDPRRFANTYPSPPTNNAEFSRTNQYGTTHLSAAPQESAAIPMMPASFAPEAHPASAHDMANEDVVLYPYLYLVPRIDYSSHLVYLPASTQATSYTQTQPNALGSSNSRLSPDAEPFRYPLDQGKVPKSSSSSGEPINQRGAVIGSSQPILTEMSANAKSAQLNGMAHSSACLNKAWAPQTVAHSPAAQKSTSEEKVPMDFDSVSKITGHENKPNVGKISTGVAESDPLPGGINQKVETNLHPENGNKPKARVTVEKSPKNHKNQMNAYQSFPKESEIKPVAILINGKQINPEQTNPNVIKLHPTGGEIVQKIKQNSDRENKGKIHVIAKDIAENSNVKAEKNLSENGLKPFFKTSKRRNRKPKKAKDDNYLPSPEAGAIKKSEENRDWNNFEILKKSDPQTYSKLPVGEKLAETMMKENTKKGQGNLHEVKLSATESKPENKKVADFEGVKEMIESKLEYKWEQKIDELMEEGNRAKDNGDEWIQVQHVKKRTGKKSQGNQDKFNGITKNKEGIEVENERIKTKKNLSIVTKDGHVSSEYPTTVKSHFKSAENSATFAASPSVNKHGTKDERRDHLNQVLEPMIPKSDGPLKTQPTILTKADGELKERTSDNKIKDHVHLHQLEPVIKNSDLPPKNEPKSVTNAGGEWKEKTSENQIKTKKKKKSTNKLSQTNSQPENTPKGKSGAAEDLEFEHVLKTISELDAKEKLGMGHNPGDNLEMGILKNMNMLKQKEYERRDKILKIQFSNAFHPEDGFEEVYPNLTKDVFVYAIEDKDGEQFAKTIGLNFNKDGQAQCSYHHLDESFKNLIGEHLDIWNDEQYLSLPDMDVSVFKKLQITWQLKPKCFEEITLIWKNQSRMAELYRRLQTFINQIYNYTVVENWKIIKEHVIKNEVFSESDVDAIEKDYMFTKMFPVITDYSKSVFHQGPIDIIEHRYPKTSELFLGLMGSQYMITRPLIRAKYDTYVHIIPNGWKSDMLAHYYKHKGLDLLETFDVANTLCLYPKGSSSALLNMPRNQIWDQYRMKGIFYSRNLGTMLIPWHESPTRHFFVTTFGKTYDIQLTTTYMELNRSPFTMVRPGIKKAKNLPELEALLDSKPGDLIIFGDCGLEFNVVRLIFMSRNLKAKHGKRKINWDIVHDYLSTKLNGRQKKLIESWFDRYT